MATRRRKTTNEKMANKGYITVLFSVKTGNIKMFDEAGKQLDGKKDPLPFPTRVKSFRQPDILVTYKHNPRCWWYRGRRYCR